MYCCVIEMERALPRMMVRVVCATAITVALIIDAFAIIYLFINFRFRGEFLFREAHETLFNYL